MKDKKEAQQSRRRNKRLVCKLLVCMLTAAVCAICCFLISLRFENEIDPPPPRADAYFYDPDYETDILSLPEYTDGYDRTFYYYVGASGVPLNADNCNVYGQIGSEFFRKTADDSIGDSVLDRICHDGFPFIFLEIASAPTGSIRTSVISYAGIIRFRFYGCDLSQSQLQDRHPKHILREI